MNARSFVVAAVCAAILPYSVCRADTTGLSSSPAAPGQQSIPGALVLPGNKQPTAQIALSSARITPGSPVAIRFTVTNRTQKDVRYAFTSAQQFDVVVSDAKGAEVWRWSKGRTFAAQMTSLSLKPGQSTSYQAQWTGLDSAGRPVPAGSYTLVAQLTPDTHPAITGGIIVSTDTDPNNIGVATRGRVETGAIRQVNVTPTVSAAAIVTVER